MKYIKNNKTIILCLDDKKSYNRLIKYINEDSLIFTSEDKIFENKINVIIKSITTGFMFNNYVVISENDFYSDKEVKKTYKSKYSGCFKLLNLDFLK
jgi:hypothetical protein